MFKLRYVTGCLLALLLCLMMGAAAADAAFIPEMKTWNWNNMPVEVTLSADVQTHMPFDENRTGQFNALMKHMSLKVHLQQSGGEAWSRLSLLVDGDELLHALQREMQDRTEAQFSTAPDVTYTWDKASGLDLAGLLGGSTGELWLDGSETVWMDDALILAEAIPGAFPQHLKDIKYQTNVQGMGQSARKQTVIIPVNALEGLNTTLAALCPEGELRTVLEHTVFSGKQTLHILRDAQGMILRIEWVGQAGLSREDMRQVSLVWRLKRSDTESKDDLTLKTPRVQGSGRNDLTLQRTLLVQGDTATMKGKLVKTTLVQSPKQVVTANFDLMRTLENGRSRVTGQLDVQHQTGNDEDYDRLVLDANVLFTGSQETPALEGTADVSRYRKRNLLEQAKLTLSAGQTGWLMWELRSSQVTVDETNQDKIAKRIQDGMTVDLVRRLVLLPQEDTLFLSADLDPQVWNQIVEAAQSALQ